MILGGAVVAVASPSLIYSALALLVTFIHVAGIYVLLNAEFIAAVQIIIYAGAILVLYLFVLMLFNPKQERFYLHRQLPVGIFLGGVILGLMFLAAFKTELIAQKGTFTVESVRAAGHTQSIGKVLYTDFIFPFEIASFILLVAMFGAILLAGRRSAPKKKSELPGTAGNGKADHVEAPSPRETMKEDASLTVQARRIVNEG
ncbi:NADH-quinone oxidoreductase subunit J [Nitrospiraceae bacterium HYJII51-Mn-bac16s-1-B09]|uniref:NADH-quinone oxidoreductase subunit J n=2 Tax=Candidatus Manganitrophus noduliformans TaxID=2606439 RepID=A0A7X6DSV1_9BACT|nr:NADH-quinone oxidoreductase subunit J [Candidatus Manganitrophus noduliformans]